MQITPRFHICLVANLSLWIEEPCVSLSSSVSLLQPSPSIRNYFQLCETLPIKCAERSGYKLAKHPLPSSVLLVIMLVDDQIGRGPHVTEMCLAWSHLAPRFRVGLTGFITNIAQSHGDPLQATRGGASGLSYRTTVAVTPRMRLMWLQEVSRHRTGCHICRQLRPCVAKMYASDKSQSRCRAYSLLAFSTPHLSMVKVLNNLARTWFPRVCGGCVSQFYDSRFRFQRRRMAVTLQPSRKASA